MSAEVELRMLEGSEFQTVGAAMLKPREAKVVRTRVTVLQQMKVILLALVLFLKNYYSMNHRLHDLS